MKRQLTALGFTLLSAQALANSATWTVQFTVQVRDTCEFLTVSPQQVDARCTVGMLAPSEPGLLPDAPASVQALNHLRLSSQEAYQGSGGGLLLHYLFNPDLSADATLPDGSVASVVYY